MRDAALETALTIAELVLAAVDSLQRVLDIAHRLCGDGVAPIRLPRFKARPQQSCVVTDVARF